MLRWLSGTSSATGCGAIPCIRFLLPRSRMKATPKYSLAVAVVGLTLLTFGSIAWTYQQTFQLNGLKLGDKLKDFRAKFPGTACGTPTSIAINRKTLDDLADPGTVTCCVDDPEQLAVFSNIQIVSIDDNCRLMVAFYRYRLKSAAYVNGARFSRWNPTAVS